MFFEEAMMIIYRDNHEDDESDHYEEKELNTWYEIVLIDTMKFVFNSVSDWDFRIEQMSFNINLQMKDILKIKLDRKYFLNIRKNSFS